MTDENVNQDSPDIERPDFENMDIAKLRQYASFARVSIPKTATKAEIIEALSAKQRGKSSAVLADNVNRVPPGHAKIQIFEDPTPGSKNFPIYFQVNGYECTIPRGKPVIVPMRIVRALADATVNKVRQIVEVDERGREYTKNESIKVPSYAYQVLEMTPGPEPLTNFERAKLKTIGPKRRYKKKFGYFPKPGQLHRAIENGLISLQDGEELEETEEKYAATIKED
jgi:hypothetical protein